MLEIVIDSNGQTSVYSNRPKLQKAFEQALYLEKANPFPDVDSEQFVEHLGVRYGDNEGQSAT
jgi:hypothetical protein